MKQRLQLFGLAIALVLSLTAEVLAQGVQTGTLTGTAKDSGGLVLPGVTVTVQSPARQGTQTAVTDGNGIYIFRGLPPGIYTVIFELASFSTVTETTTVPLGGTASLSAALALATVTETVVVVAETPTVLTTPQGGANYRTEEVNTLATPRTLQGIAALAPGLTENTPNAGQVTISGAFAYDNVFLVDGVDTNDNLFGTSNNLFIEDAIEEVQVLTSGVSAEYGRFSGGVINAITKSGSNDFSGSFRVNFTNSEWTEETPFEKRNDTKRPDKLSKFYEGTFGGPVLTDRLWFFSAGRVESSTQSDPFPQTGIPVDRLTENKRVQLKLTGTVAANHTLQGAYVNNSTEQTQPTFTFSIHPSTIVTRTLPNRLFVANYRGVLGSKYFATAQYSEKKFGFRNSGGTSRDIFDSPILSRGVAPGVVFGHYNAPYFDSSDPEDRNNRQVAGSVSYFLTTRRWGSHDIKSGVESFATRRVAGNSQSSTDYVIQADYKVVDGRPALDNGNLIPTFVPGVTRLQNFLATRGARVDLRTNSFYAHDRWTANDRWTFDVGLRYERVRGVATGDIITADTDTLVPRLGVTYAIKANGDAVLQATYAHYAGKYSETQFADNTPVGNPSLVLGSYIGPAGEGKTFAPGFNPANYTTIGGNFPTANVFLDKGLTSPVTKEFTFSAGSKIGGDGFGKFIYTWRDTRSFIEDFITLEGGQTTVVREGRNFGTFDNVIVRNSNAPVREYQAVQFQGRYRITNRWYANGHWTVQIKNDGNFEGEGTNTPGVASLIGDYPEVFVAERNYPTGRLNDFQRDKVRLWTVYTAGLRRLGTADISALYRFDSPTTYSLTAAGVPLSALQVAKNAGYARPAGGGQQTVFFGGRGTNQFEEAHLVDLAVTYSIPVFRTLKPWLKFEATNVFNNDALIGFDTTVTADRTGPVDQDGLPTQFVRGPRFGESIRVVDHPSARTFRVAMGLRF